MARRRRFSRIMLGIGGGLVVAAVLWWTLAVPALVKYPTNLNISPQYTGTLTLFVDPTTAAPLGSPTVLPLTIDRNIKSIKSQSGANRVLVQETVTQHAGSINSTYTNVYVMDRRTLKNVADPRAYAFTPTNVVDRSGTYRVNLPFDTSRNNQYRIYKNEIGTTYTFASDKANPTSKLAGLKVDNFTGALKGAPLTAGYVAELNRTIPLPTSLTLDQLKPALLAQGINVDATLAALAPVITQADLVSLGALAAQPIKLQYVLSFEGKGAVEPMTGGEVNVAATETVGAVPQMADLPRLQAILGHYPNVPLAVTASQRLGTAATTPVSLFAIQYQQTPASLVTVANKVKDMRQQILLARRYVPFGLLALALVALIAGVATWPRRPLAEVEELPVPTEVPTEVPAERRTA